MPSARSRQSLLLFLLLSLVPLAGQALNEKTPIPENVTIEAQEEADTSVDQSIDQQLETARQTENEPDLLEDKN